MFKNYLKIAFRNLSKRKVFSTVNITGLSIALFIAILTTLFVLQEINYDNFHSDYDNIYRINTVFGEEMRSEGSISQSPAALKTALQENIPEIDFFTRIISFKLPVKSSVNVFDETTVFAEADFFNIFSFELIQGNSESPFNNPNSVIITQKMAGKYFQDGDPIGKTLSIFFKNEYHDFTVSGIIEEAPESSSIKYDFIFNYEWLVNNYPSTYDVNNWAPNVFNYIKLNTSSTEENAQKNISALIEQVRGPELEEYGFKRDAVVYELQPMNTIHLNTNVKNSPNTILLGPPPSNILYSYILSSIAFIVLLIACINYTTFSIGNSVYRVKEVGVRKTLGAQKKHIMIQTWIETSIITLVSVILSIFLVQLSIPFINVSMDLNLLFKSIFDPASFITITCVLLITSLIAGSYPSLILSRLNPSKILKSSYKSKSGKSLSKFLITVQYIGVIALIASVFIMYKQLGHIQSKSYANEEDQILILKNQENLNIDYITSYNRIKSEIESRGNYIATGSYGAVNDDFYFTGYKINSNSEIVYTRAFFTDYNYLDVYDDISLKSGRFFNEKFLTDKDNAVVVNEAFVKALGIESPVGEVVKTNTTRIHNSEVTIIGVVEDFHYESLHTEIGPAVFLLKRENIPLRYISIEFNASETNNVIEASEQIWEKIHPDLPFEYTFLDQRYARFYKTEKRWKDIISYASFFGIFITIMGVLALTGLTASTRKKEIGIRKVLGASIQSIILLLSKQFMLSILIAFIIAIPLVYLVMNQWLQNFSYAVNIGIIPYLLAGLTAILITALAFINPAYNASVKDPIESLKSE